MKAKLVLLGLSGVLTSPLAFAEEPLPIESFLGGSAANAEAAAKFNSPGSRVWEFGRYAKTPPADTYAEFQLNALHRDPHEAVIRDGITGVLDMHPAGISGEVRFMQKADNGAVTETSFGIPKTWRPAEMSGVELSQDGQVWNVTHLYAGSAESQKYTLFNDGENRVFRSQIGFTTVYGSGRTEVNTVGSVEKINGYDHIAISITTGGHDFHHYLNLSSVVPNGRLLGFHLSDNHSRVTVQMFNRDTGTVDEYEYALTNRTEIDAQADRVGRKIYRGADVLDYLAIQKKFPAPSARVSVTTATDGDAISFIQSK